MSGRGAEGARQGREDTLELELGPRQDNISVTCGSDGVPTGKVPIPARAPESIGRPRPSGGRSGSLRWLRRALAVVAVLDLLAIGALAATYTGLLGSSRRSSRGSGPGSDRASAIAISEVGSTPSSADYRVSAATYEMSVTARYPCWVDVVDADRSLFAGVMTAGAVRTFRVSGQSRVVIGSGGGSVTVRTRGHSQRLVPPSAPYTLTFTGS